MIGFVGDVHGHFDGLRSLMRSYPEIKEWVQVGDLGSESGLYEDFPSCLTFVSGNHENWGEIASMDEINKFDNLLHLQNGDVFQIEGLNFLGFGGNYSSKYFEYAKKDLPQNRRRHFVREEYERALEWLPTLNIDVVVTHEAPTPYKKSWRGTEREMGIELITDLVNVLEPKYHIFGHHHRMTIKEIGTTISIGLGYWDHEIFILNPETQEMAYIDKENKIHRELLISS